LTVTAVREASSGEWALESGALVLADGGLCCIDEFDGIKDRDRAAMHEVMEQQTLSVAKAGLVMTLDTRTTVFAAVNPKVGKMRTNDDLELLSDPATELALSVGIAPPLLSRFDVTVTLLDKHESHWDEKLSDFILNDYKDTSVSCNTSRLYSGGSKYLWNTEELQMYIYFVKEAVEPELTCSAQRIVSKYYTMQRQASGRNAARTTVRFLESLIRLTQAHARMLFRRLAVVQDAIYAVFVTESSAFGNDVLQLPSNLQNEDSFECADLWYKAYSQAVLQKMGLAEIVNPNEYLNDYDRLLIYDLPKRTERRCSTGQNTQTVLDIENASAEKRKTSSNKKYVSFDDANCNEANGTTSDIVICKNNCSCEKENFTNKRLKIESPRVTGNEKEPSSSKMEATAVDCQDRSQIKEKTANEEIQEMSTLQLFQDLDEEEIDSALLGSWILPRDSDQ